MISTEHPYLIQRVMRRKSPLNERGGTKGIDLHFRFSYMGSSEFEFGTLPNSLSEMRNGHSIVLTPLNLTTEDGECEATFVGRSDEFNLAAFTILADLNGTGSFKERPLFQAGLYGDGGPDGWFALQQKRHDYDWVPFVIFKDEEDAKLWKRLVEEGRSD